MCGIAGIFYLNGNSPDNPSLKEIVERGLVPLRNRGPDESSVVQVGKHCALGGNRLAIRGHVGLGSMPFRDGEDVCFYNGEIYNFRKWSFNAVSDGEVILPLYKEDGTKSFSMFDGEFALSIWDARRACLILVRDPFGTKPLYFSLNEQRLLWGSSASAVNSMESHHHCAKVPSPVSQHTTSVQEPYTSYSGIWQLPPGHILKATRSGVFLYPYHAWNEIRADSMDPKASFSVLEQALATRFDYDGVIAIPMSGGIDSGILAFAAERLGVKYHIFSVVEMLGEDTREKETILRRIDRLRKPVGVTLLRCGEQEYQDALAEMFAPDYYDYETFDSGNIPIHTVFSAIQKEGIRVSVDGGGGDELFHGYKFRDDFKPIPGWPQTWQKTKSFYSLYTTLLSWTAKSDRAGAHFSIETRFPYQSVPLMNEAASLCMTSTPKWPLREYLLKHLDYGPPLPLDLDGKEGFSLKHREPASIVRDMRKAWCKANGLSRPSKRRPIAFPFDAYRAGPERRPFKPDAKRLVQDHELA